MNKAEAGTGVALTAAGSSALGFWLIPDRRQFLNTKEALILQKEEIYRKAFKEFHGREPSLSEFEEMVHGGVVSMPWGPREEADELYRTGSISWSERKEMIEDAFEDRERMFSIIRAERDKINPELYSQLDDVNNDLFWNGSLILTAAGVTLLGVLKLLNSLRN